MILASSISSNAIWRWSLNPNHLRVTRRLSINRLEKTISRSPISIPKSIPTPSRPLMCTDADQQRTIASRTTPSAVRRPHRRWNRSGEAAVYTIGERPDVAMRLVRRSPVTRTVYRREQFRNAVNEARTGE